MGRFDADFLAQACGGQWSSDQPAEGVSGFSYDTRSLSSGDLFIAIKTPVRDGHNFLGDALAKGASAALVEKPIDSVDLPQLIVSDTLEAFRGIARAYRRQWRFPVIGITGSCGKTTVKDLLSILLGGVDSVHSTAGNLNNLIGVPSTILEADKDRVSFAVIEAGISEPGEMEKLAWTIEPDVALFTAIGPAHLEGLGNLDTIAREKGFLAVEGKTERIYLGRTWKPYASVVANGNGLTLEENSEPCSKWSYRKRFEGQGTRIEVMGPDGLEDYWIETLGEGSASNAALAIAVSRDLGVPQKRVEDRLRGWRPSGMRGEWRSIGHTRAYIDCYNANPLSMIDSLDAFRQMSTGPRLYVIGSMEELGTQSAMLHEQLGAELELRPKDEIRLIGDWAKSIFKGMESAGHNMNQVEIVESVEALEPLLGRFVGDVFLKGSRRYRLETAIDYIKAETIEERASC